MPNKQSVSGAGSSRRTMPPRKPGSTPRLGEPPPRARRRWVAPVAVLAVLLFLAGLYGVFRSSSAPATATTRSVAPDRASQPRSSLSAPQPGSR